VFEVEGEYAQAILEYQDALRYDANHAIQFALSKCYARLNKPGLAVEAAKEALRQDPDRIDYLRNVGDIYASAFQIDSAAAVYERVVQRDSNNIQSWFTLANLYEGRKPLKALEVYESILERFGDEWEVLLQISELYNVMGQTGKAIDALQRMAAIDPGNLELKRSLAQAYVRDQQYDQALKIYNDLRERDPDNLDYLGELATVHLLKKDYRQAAELFDIVLTRDSVTVDAKLRIGEAYFSQLQTDSTLIPVARSMFTRISENHPDDWRPYWFLGAIGGVSGDDSATVRNFRKVTELASWNPDGWVYLSGVYLQHEEFDRVIAILEQAQTYVPDNYLVNLYLGIAYNRVGRNTEAMNVLEHACRIDPGDVRALTQLGLIYDAERRFDQSDSLYEEALKLQPENDLILNNYSYSLAERGVELDRALGMARRAVDAKPDNASYLDTIGWIYFRLGRYDEAEKYVKSALEKGETNSVVHEHLGDIYYMTDEKDLALEQWKIALDLDRDNEALREKIARGSL
jgi:tetratricopeptide (TPR) repeat protein